MTEYHKIHTIFKRDPKGRILEGEYSLPEFDYLKNNRWVMTEKVDGMNIRIMWKDLKISFGGKTDAAKLPASLFVRLDEIFKGKENVFADLFTDAPVCLYGEGYGARIQKIGGKYRPDQDFVLFDISVGHMWLRRDSVYDIAAKLDLIAVPEMGTGTLPEIVEFCRHGFNSKWGDFEAEGIVARPEVELRSRAGVRMITKLKCRDFRVGVK